MTEVTPIHRYEKGGETYEHRYTFRRIDLDAINPDDINVDNVNVMEWDVNGEDSVHWSYKQKPAVIIFEDRVETSGDSRMGEAERQAYFALSVLSDKYDCVEGWRKMS